MVSWRLHTAAVPVWFYGGEQYPRFAAPHEVVEGAAEPTTQVTPRLELGLRKPTDPLELAEQQDPTHVARGEPWPRFRWGMYDR
jgi:hypothetical protein